MTKSRCIFSQIIRIVIAGVFAVAFLCLFVYATSFSGVHITNTTGATDYKWETGQLKSNMTEGFAWLIMDENGFNNISPISSHIDILLMGSSHMEAVNIPSSKNVGSLLNEYMPQMYTYNIGISGHDMYSSINNISNAVGTYTPSQYVIIETSTVSLDLDKMKAVTDGTHERIPSYDTGLLYVIQKKIPAVKSVYKCLEDWWSAGKTASSDTEVGDKSLSATYTEALSSFLCYAKASFTDNQKLIFFYHPVTSIDSMGSLAFSTDENYIAVFRDACEANDIIFIDMTDDFKTLYKEQHKLPYGFINTAIGSGHLNAAGHEVIAKRLVGVIEELEQGGNYVSK